MSSLHRVRYAENLPQLSTDREYVAIAGLVLSALFVISWSFQVWAVSATVIPALVPLSLATVIVGFLGMMMAPVQRLNRLASFLLLLSSVALFIAWVHLQTTASFAYTTDELSFDQYAAQLFMHGVDPYGVNLSPSLQLFGAQPTGFTFTISGQHVSYLSYPDLSFLLYVPWLLFGVHAQMAVYADAAFWALAMVLLWFLLPPRFRFLSIIFFAFSRYVSYVVGGVTGSLYLPFLIVALWRWDRFGDPEERSAARFIGPIMLGLAMAVKQTPWFVAPFVFVAMIRESMAAGEKWYRRALSYTLWAGGTFFAVNLPFIVWHPGAWLHGILLPITAHAVGDGQGLIALLIYNHVGSGNLSAFTNVGAVLTVLLVSITFLFYERVKRIWPAFIPFLFFWPDRAFSSYMVDLIPALVLAMLTARSGENIAPIISPKHLGRVWGSRAWLGLWTVAGLGFLGQALLGQQPLQLTVNHYIIAQGLSAVQQLDVTVTNHSNHAQQPHFTITNTNDNFSTFWLRKSGPTVLPAHHTAHYVLLAPNVASEPSIWAGFYVDAFTDNPQPAMSDTTMVPPHLSKVVLDPSAINHSVPAGKTVKLTASLRNTLGQVVDKSGEYIGLSEYEDVAGGTVVPDVSLNGQPPSTQFVWDKTNAHGTVTFYVKALSAQKGPVYFQAILYGHNDQPIAYS
ncbi:MAG: hypothetical protein OWS74_01985, partial [Firmicutes bacterium]|nr:hypothetical protein [Bacillota bacterium]